MLRRDLAAVCFRDIAAIGDTKQSVMGLIHTAFREVAIIRRHQRNIMLVRKVDQTIFDPVFIRQIVTLDLDIETVSENFLQALGRFFSLLGLVMQQVLRHRSLDPTTEADQTFAALLDHLPCYMRLYVGFHIHEGAADQNTKITIPFFRLCQQNQLMTFQP